MLQDTIVDITCWFSESPSEPSLGWDTVIKRICISGIFRFRDTTLVFGPSGTFNGFRHDKPVTKRIDYIFTDKVSLEVKKYAVLSDSYECRYPSDHMPVYVEVKIK